MTGRSVVFVLATAAAVAGCARQHTAPVRPNELPEAVKLLAARANVDAGRSFGDGVVLKNATAEGNTFVIRASVTDPKRFPVELAPTIIDRIAQERISEGVCRHNAWYFAYGGKIRLELLDDTGKSILVSTVSSCQGNQI